MASGNNSVITSIIILLFCSNCFAFDIKVSYIAGTFYPNRKKELSGQIDIYLNKAVISQVDDIGVLISPHAGYVYSGEVAAFGYKALIGKDYDTVIIIGASHKNDFVGIATGNWQYYRTPLGDSIIDQVETKRIMSKTKLLKFNNDVFTDEHSVDVQIPFLQKVLPNAKIIPILTGRVSLEEIKSFSKDLIEASGKTKTLLVASTDLSHYLSYEDARSIDNNTIKNIENMEIEEFNLNIAESKIQLCGEVPVMIAMSYAKLQDYTAQILKYANSGDTSGDKTRVVGYVSLAFVKENLKKEKAMFSKEQKKTLLEIARSTIERYLNNTEKPKLLDSDPALVEEKGVFVTLYKKNGDLRGCIGSIDPIGPLNRTIEEMAIASSTQDPRFPPLSLSELKEIEIEISVLSVPRLISSADDIKMGVHGVIVKRGFNSGVFLPQVATETGWTKEEFLNNLCEHKAGLEKNAWKDKSTKLYTFTAEVFSEKDVN